MIEQPGSAKTIDIMGSMFGGVKGHLSPEDKRISTPPPSPSEIEK